MENVPKVSVIVLAYNHELYIDDCLISIINQRTNFNYEIIIGEDHSSDNTLNIINKYKHLYPNLITVIASTSNVGFVENEYRAMISSRGKYIAFCEADDYWIDEYKLQKQFDFLESNINYSICFHRCKLLNEISQILSDDILNEYIFGCDGIDVSLELFFKQWITQPLSMFFRKDMLDFSIYQKYKYFRDTHLIYHLLKNGKGFILNFFGGVYRHHNQGVHSLQSIEYKLNIALNVSKELYISNNEVVLLENYLNTINWGIDINIKELRNYKKALTLILLYFYYKKSLKHFYKHFYKLFVGD